MDAPVEDALWATIVHLDVGTSGCPGWVSDKRGSLLSSVLVDSASTLLAHWAVASVLGLALGTGLLLSSRASFRAMTPESAESGLAFIAVSLFVRMAIAAGVLFAYRHFVPDGFTPFAAGVAGGFFVLYAIELTRYGRVLVRSR